MVTKIKNFIVKLVQFFLNPRFLLCFGLGWIITNGWSYIMFAVGTYFQIGWMIAVAGAYLTFLWLPISPEKLVTVTIAMFLLKKLFPNDQKTLAVLNNIYETTKNALTQKKNKEK